MPDVGLHICEAFQSLDPGVRLTVAEIAATPTTEYPQGCSVGPVVARLHQSKWSGIYFDPKPPKGAMRTFTPRVSEVSRKPRP